MKPFALFIYLLMAAFDSQSQHNKKNIATQRPNIIYIMTDDMGYGDLSCYGNKKFTTAHLDQLASEGMRFSNAYAAAPVCTPTRTAIITGRYPARLSLGLLEPLRSPGLDSAYGLTSDIPSLGIQMKAAGYKTALIGKWHLGFLPKHRPTKNGFDYFFGIISGAADYNSHRGANDNRDHDLLENESHVYTKGYLTEMFSDKAVAFLKQKHTKPFFLMLPYTAPHWPWQGPTDEAYPDSVNFTDGGSPEIYKAMMQSLDEGIGKIMQALRQSNLENNTLVIFTNDNGGERFSDNGGLAKAKMSLWEGGIKVPAFVRWPGKIKAGSSSNQLVTTMDWTATMLSAALAKPLKDYPLDGIDLLPILTGDKKTIERKLYWRIFQRAQQKAMRDGKWKYLKDKQGEYLFDIEADPAEKTDLKAMFPGRLEQMKQLLAEWENTMLPPIPL